MLEKIHKFASETSRPIAICGKRKHTHTHTHTQIDKWGRATKEWAQNVESRENGRVAQLKRDASAISQKADMTLVHNL